MRRLAAVDKKIAGTPPRNPRQMRELIPRIRLQTAKPSVRATGAP
jgi:hypothetical protein